MVRPLHIDEIPLPEPLRRYVPSRIEPPPLSAARWTLSLTTPPYTQTRQITDLVHLATSTQRGYKGPPRGPILVAEPLESLDPSDRFPELGWIRRYVPWCSPVVRGLNSTSGSLLEGLLAKLARRGAVIAPEAATVDDFTGLIANAFVPAVDVPAWFRDALPGWSGTAQARAVRQFLAGFGAPESTDVRSRQPLWTRVGRALRASIVIQLSAVATSGLPARATGYHDFRAMDRSLVRIFGLYSRGLRGTAGWEWLLWRFLCHLGDGREQRWDR